MKDKEDLKPLNEKQQRFCREYLIDLNGTKAAIRAGYKEKNARSTASENLTKPNIQAEIKRLIEERSDRTKITADNVLKKLWRWANANIFELLEVDWVEGSQGEKKQILRFKQLEDIPEEMQDCVKGLTIAKDGSVKVELVDKLASARLVGLNLALFTQKVDHTSGGKPMDFPAPVIMQINHRKKGELLEDME